MKLPSIQKFHLKRIVNVKATKEDGSSDKETQTCVFAIDPELTTFERLQALVARVFNTREEFSLLYQTAPECHQSLTSDWDLDAALESHSQPYLRLLVRVHPSNGLLEDWDLVTPADFVVPQECLDLIEGVATPSPPSSPVSWIRRVGRTIGLALGWGGECKEDKPPMTETEYSFFMDTHGKMIRLRDLFIAVYRGGVGCAGLRREVWPHLLNVYPSGLTASQRAEYLRNKCEQYRILSQQSTPGPIAELVRKDVLRTDRQHSFFAGENNANVAALSRLLCAYAMNHPRISYCQGMSDLAAPILYTMQDESVSYLCFCGLMRRLQSNFVSGGKLMVAKFQHLSLLLSHYDPQLYDYFKSQNAHDLLFCYRWLLLELKREFPFNEALHLMEVVWSSIPPDPPHFDLPLCEVEEDEGIENYSVVSNNNESFSMDSSADHSIWCESSSGSERSSLERSMPPSRETSCQDDEEDDGGGDDEFGDENKPFLQASPIPPPEEFGCGNPFLLFVCVCLLCQHRTSLMENTLEFSEIGMYFDKLVRKHDVRRALSQARAIFGEYLVTGSVTPIS